MSHGTSHAKIPKDAQVIDSILKEIGITDYEPRVINQLLEFTYRYVTCILDDAKVYASHAKKKVIDAKDVKLATQMMLDKAFTTPPTRDVLFEVARAKNSTPLPLVKINCGLRLPPDRYCLSACNYKLRAASQAKKITKSALEGRSTLKTQFKAGGMSIVNATLKKPTPVAVPKTQTVTIPKPVFKFTSNASSKTITIKPKVEGMKMEVDDYESTSVKRKREEDEFEIVE